MSNLACDEETKSLRFWNFIFFSLTRKKSDQKKGRKEKSYHNIIIVMIAYSHRLSLPFRSHTCRRVRSWWWQKSKRKLKISLSPLNFPNPAEVLKFSQFRRRNLLTVLLLIMLVSKLQNFLKKIIKSSSVCHHQHHHHDSVSSSLWNEWKLIFFSLLKTENSIQLYASRTIWEWDLKTSPSKTNIHTFELRREISEIFFSFLQMFFVLFGNLECLFWSL